MPTSMSGNDFRSTLVTMKGLVRKPNAHAFSKRFLVKRSVAAPSHVGVAGMGATALNGLADAV
jgi:hypothetical protein